jgi:hypothetical protein
MAEAVSMVLSMKSRWGRGACIHKNPVDFEGCMLESMVQRGSKGIRQMRTVSAPKQKGEAVGN